MKCCYISYLSRYAAFNASLFSVTNYHVISPPLLEVAAQLALRKFEWHSVV